VLTAFVTGSTFVTLPMIVDNARALLREKQVESEVNPEVVVPLGYPFPHLGKLMGLLFVPFAAWFYGDSMAAADFPQFLASGLFGSFGSLVVTIPMLLDQQQLPADIFQLFLLSGVVAARISDVLGSVHILAFALITTYGMAGLWKLRPRRLLAGLAGLGAAALVLIGGTRLYLATSFLADHEKQDLLGTMVSVEPQVEAVLLDRATPNPVPLRAGQSRLDRARERGAIRVGTSLDNLPFAFRNAREELVGLDVDMAHRLALDLGMAWKKDVRLELVPIDLGLLGEQALTDCFDLVMAGIEVTLLRSASVDLSDPYLRVNGSLVVLDHRADEFASMESIQRMGHVRVAVWRGGYASENTIRHVERAEYVPIDAVSEFFESPGAFDALITSAEVGYAWTLRYPEYAVVNPLEHLIGVPLAYPIAGRDPVLHEFIDNWLELRRSSGTIDRLYDYWILGRGAETAEPRWSVIRDVLGWVR